MILKKTTLDFIKEIKIVNPNIQVLGKYINSKTKIKCKCMIDNTEWMATPNNLLNGAGCPLCGIKKTTIKTMKTNDEFLKQLYKINPNIEILSTYNGNRHYVLCRCKIDNYQWNNTPTHLLDGQGCPVCSNHKVMQGVNDIWATNPKLAKLLANPKDGYKYTEHSAKRVDWECPNCGEIIKNKRIHDVNQEGLSCPKCSDGVSYPNKLMYNLLKFLNIDFINEYKPNWCRYELNSKSKYGIYDFYIPSKNLIIEMDGGLGHGNKIYNHSMSLTETKEIDNCKDNLAKKHGIIVIRIDCNYSSCNKLDYIKNNILHSKLSEIFDLALINWNYIDTESLTSSIIKSAILWNKGYCMKQIADFIHKNPTTVSKYIRKADKIGLCKYVPYKYSGKNIDFHRKVGD